MAATTFVMWSPRAIAAWEPRYAVQGLVLENRAHGPQLCLGAFLESSPPQCDGVPLVGWRWSRVHDESTDRGTTWGHYRLVGSYDGKRFSVINVGPPRYEGRLLADVLATQCDAPRGGWVNRDPSKLGILEQAAMGDAAQASPDFVTMWMDRSQGVPVQNVAFTGPTAPHRAQLEAIWGGPICVLQFERSMNELEAIQDTLTDESVRKLGLEYRGDHLDEFKNRVELFVLIKDDGAQRRVDRQYGKGVVKVRSVFERVR